MNGVFFLDENNAIFRQHGGYTHYYVQDNIVLGPNGNTGYSISDELIINPQTQDRGYITEDKFIMGLKSAP